MTCQAPPVPVPGPSTRGSSMTAAIGPEDRSSPELLQIPGEPRMQHSRRAGLPVGAGLRRGVVARGHPRLVAGPIQRARSLDVLVELLVQPGEMVLGVGERAEMRDRQTLRAPA